MIEDHLDRLCKKEESLLYCSSDMDNPETLSPADQARRRGWEQDMKDSKSIAKLADKLDGSLYIQLAHTIFFLFSYLEPSRKALPAPLSWSNIMSVVGGL